MYEHNPSEYKSVDFINNCGSWCPLFISWHRYFVQNLTTLISYRPMIGTITHDDSSMLDKLRATNHLFFWPYFPRIINLTNVHFLNMLFLKLSKQQNYEQSTTLKIWFFLFRYIFWNLPYELEFQNTSEFSWILFRSTCRKPWYKNFYNHAYALYEYRLVYS